MINMPGGPEVMVIILVALIVLGPQQLPKAMRTFGNVMAEIRKISSGFQAEMRSAMDTFTEEPAKAHSATMAPAPGPSLDPVAELPEATEVVARNPAPTAEDGASTAADPAPAAPAAPTGPAIDPIDRAAG